MSKVNELELEYHEALQAYKEARARKEELRKKIFSEMNNEPGRIFAYEVYRIKRKGSVNYEKMFMDEWSMTKADMEDMMDTYRRPGTQHLGIRLHDNFQIWKVTHK